MKTITIATALVLMLAGCSKEPTQQLDPNAMISIRADLTATSLTKAGHLSNLEIIRQAYDMNWHNDQVSGTQITRGIIDAHRDEANLRLLMWGTDIIDQNGSYVIDFIEGRDFVIRRRLNNPTEWPPVFDTVAYIPQSVIVAARNHIRTAYDQGDYRTVYDLFDNAFTFRATTGAEWRALKAQGKN